MVGVRIPGHLNIAYGLVGVWGDGFVDIGYEMVGFGIAFYVGKFIISYFIDKFRLIVK